MATGDIRIREAIGTIDGANVSFTTPENYQAGSIQSFLNGVLQRLDYLTETGSNAFDLEFPPRIDDTVHVRYVEQ